MTIRYTADAHRDLLDALDQIVPEAPETAGSFVERLFAVLEQIARGDYDGPQTRLSSGEVVRSWPVPPYRVYYERERDGILVVRLYHQARRPIVR